MVPTKAIPLLWILILTSACSSEHPTIPPTPVPSTHALPVADDWALTPDTFVEYKTVAGVGIFDPDACMIVRDDLAGSNPQADSRMTNFAYTLPDGTPAIARVWSYAGVAVASVPPSLSATLVEASTGSFIGEAGNAGATVQWPPEPLTTLHPVAGESFTTHSIITWSAGGQLLDYPTFYKTVAVDVTIDGFEHSTVTCLVEAPGSANPVAYINVFSGGELAEIWYGQVDAQGKVAMYYSKLSLRGQN